ncbi:uncharacterized protein [Miscanthus floridulus]|uniref:uncharacterized protein n=1 Tax=Miscanthus floridulus TaxID=154761 RepID=UPI003457FB9A
MAAPDNRARGDGRRVLPTTAKTPGDPPAISSPVRPTSKATTAASDPTGPDAVAASPIWTSSGTDCAAPSDATMAASNSARSMSGAISVATGGADCATPSDMTTAMFGCSWPDAVAIAYSATTKGAGTTAGVAGPANEAATLPPKTGAKSGSTRYPV